MLYRLALVQYGDKWQVKRIMYTKMKDSLTTGIFVRDSLGPAHNSLHQAGVYLGALHGLLARIEFQDQIINDPNEDSRLKSESKAARASLVAELVKLTGVVP